MHNHPPPGAGLGWPHEAMNVAVERERQHRMQMAAWRAQQQQGGPIIPPPPPLPPPHLMHQSGLAPPPPPHPWDHEQRLMQERQEAVAPPPPPPHVIREEGRRAALGEPQPPVGDEEVVEIDDSDSDDDDVVEVVDGFEYTKRKRDEGKAKDASKKRKKRRNSEASEKAATRMSLPRNPVARAPPPVVPVAPSPLAGVFVTGVLSGHLLDTEREANRDRAFSNIIMGATGHDRHAVENPPPQVTLSLEQVRSLGNGFLADRNHAVREAVRIAQKEMFEKHREMIMGQAEMLKSEIARRQEAETILQTVNDEANKHVAERVRLNTENLHLREELSGQAGKSSTHMRLCAENLELKNKLSKQAKKKDAEIARLKKKKNPGHLPSKNSYKKLREENAEGFELNNGLREQVRQKDEEITKLKQQLDRSRKRKKGSKEEDALKEEIKSLKRQLKYQESRQARSVAAIMQASAHSLRLLQSKRDSM